MPKRLYLFKDFIFLQNADNDQLRPLLHEIFDLNKKKSQDGPVTPKVEPQNPEEVGATSMDTEPQKTDEPQSSGAPEIPELRPTIGFQGAIPKSYASKVSGSPVCGTSGVSSISPSIPLRQMTQNVTEGINATAYPQTLNRLNFTQSQIPEGTQLKGQTVTQSTGQNYLQPTQLPPNLQSGGFPRLSSSPLPSSVHQNSQLSPSHLSAPHSLSQLSTVGTPMQLHPTQLSSPSKLSPLPRTTVTSTSVNLSGNYLSSMASRAQPETSTDILQSPLRFLRQTHIAETNQEIDAEDMLQRLSPQDNVYPSVSQNNTYLLGRQDPDIQTFPLPRVAAHSDDSCEVVDYSMRITEEDIQ